MGHATKQYTHGCFVDNFSVRFSTEGFWMIGMIFIFSRNIPSQDWSPDWSSWSSDWSWHAEGAGQGDSENLFAGDFRWKLLFSLETDWKIMKNHQVLPDLTISMLGKNDAFPRFDRWWLVSPPKTRGCRRWSDIYGQLALVDWSFYYPCHQT